MNKSAENYIKTIYILKNRKERLLSVDVARELGFSKASVSIAVSNLRNQDIITINKDGVISFTEKGHMIAQEIYDRYIVLCGFLQTVAGIDETTAKEEAWSIGHYLSNRTYDGIRRFVKMNTDKMELKNV